LKPKQAEGSVPVDKEKTEKVKIVKQQGPSIHDYDKGVFIFDQELDFERTSYEIDKRLTDISLSRGKNDMDKIQNDIMTLKYCLGDDLNEIKQLDIIIVLLNLRVECIQNKFMEREMWLSSFSNLKKFLAIVESNAELKDGMVINYLKNAETTYLKTEVMELIKSNLITINQQWNYAVGNLDQHDMEYDLRLRDEIDLMKLMDDCINYFFGVDCKEIVGEISFRFLEHVYHNSQHMVRKIRERVSNYIVPEDSSRFIRK